MSEDVKRTLRDNIRVVRYSIMSFDSGYLIPLIGGIARTFYDRLYAVSRRLYRLFQRARTSEERRGLFEEIVRTRRLRGIRLPDRLVDMARALIDVYETRDTLLRILTPPREEEIEPRTVYDWVVSIKNTLSSLRDTLREYGFRLERIEREIAFVEKIEREKEKLIPPPPPPKKVRIVEVTAYLNYIPGMRGGRGKDKEYKILKWVKEGEEYDPDLIRLMREIWECVFYWLPPYGITSYDVNFGLTNRVEELDIEEYKKVEKDIENYVYAMIIDAPTRLVDREGEGNIKKILRYCEEHEERGYAAIRWNEPPIHYYKPP